MVQSIRKISQNGIDFIRRWEGCCLHPYRDVVNKMTIGVGHLIRSGEDFSNGITEKQAEDLLRQDLQKVIISIGRLIIVPLTESQFVAICSFTFNLGSGALQRSTLRSCLNRGEYLAAANEFPRWCYAGGIKLKGLLRRRMAERKLFLS